MRLRREAKSLLHKMCHMLKNPYCATCQKCKIKAAQAKRRDPKLEVAPRRFGDLVLGDHVVMPNEQGSCGETAGLLLKDKGTNWRDLVARPTSRPANHNA